MNVGGTTARHPKVPNSFILIYNFLKAVRWELGTDAPYGVDTLTQGIDPIEK